MDQSDSPVMPDPPVAPAPPEVAAPRPPGAASTNKPAPPADQE